MGVSGLNKTWKGKVLKYATFLIIISTNVYSAQQSRFNSFIVFFSSISVLFVVFRADL